MATLRRELRRDLERVVVTARGVAEEGARKALDELAVSNDKPWPSMTDGQKKLRNRLRAHGRQLGDRRDERRGSQDIKRLVQECAYEHWHRMLFARFLAECDLLIEPDTGLAISLDECRELALERGTDWLVLASEFAVRMLSQIFRAGDPVLEVKLPPETRLKLEKILEELPRDVFIADDSLGWVYQFWQTAEKDLINKSEKKIGAEEIPAVTQLFTEDYMVLFLLHNTLGAWWAGKRLAANPELARNAESEDELRTAFGLPGVDWTYLRFVRGDDQVWSPAAETFDGWPKTAKEITLLDPCMGSGHFLVFALPILAAFRMSEDGLLPEEAVYAVLRDNLFGLEIDPRCTQIAAFNLALAAWRMVGYEQLPPLQLACSGLSLGVSKSEWLRLAERAAAVAPLPPKRDLFGSEDNLFSARIKNGFEGLYDLFAKAPWIGSLLNPSSMGSDLYAANFGQLEPLLAPILELTDSYEMAEAAVAARGMSKAAELLGRQFTLVATNVPYLGRGKQDKILKDYSKDAHPTAHSDLATSFIERSLNFCVRGGSAALVTPQNWLFLPTYTRMRQRMLREIQVDVVVRLGANAFQDMNFWAATTALVILTTTSPSEGHTAFGVDASKSKERSCKQAVLQSGAEPLTAHVSQSAQMRNPDARISMEEPPTHQLLSSLAFSPQGTKTGDDSRFRRNWWEVPIAVDKRWRLLHGAPDATRFVDGMAYALDFSEGLSAFARPQGQSVWGKRGVVIKLMGEIAASHYFGDVFDSNVTALVPRSGEHLAAIWCFIQSPQFNSSLRAIEQSVKVNNATVGKVPIDLTHWQKIAAEKYPHGLPKPASQDPTQWLCKGHPSDSDLALQVAVARLVGFSWPRQSGSSFPDCPALESDGLERHADEDGIVCLVPLRGEASAAERLRALLADAFGAKWSALKQNELVTTAGFAAKSLEDWLCDDFFHQHCSLFHQRPFIWHVWDGLRNGFSALVNYHHLAAPNAEGQRTLEKLIYTYLGDWIDRQRADQKSGVEGADARVAAAEHLKRELEKILDGEPPYDIFVRWRSLDGQPIGWEPEIADGIRINIRPFMVARPFNSRARNACILRTMPRITRAKDRGKEPNRPKGEYPWFWSWDESDKTDFAGGSKFDGNRWNDLHYTRKFKQAARERHVAVQKEKKR